VAALAGYLATKAMEPVSEKLYELESDTDRAREDAARPGPPYRIAAEKITRLIGVRLDAQQPCRHLEVIRRLVQLKRANAQQELFRDPRDGNVVDVDLLFADQRQQQVERPGEGGQLDGERLRPALSRRRRGHSRD